MGLWDRMKAGIQIVVGGHSQGRVIVKGATANSGHQQPKQGEAWLHAYNTMPWLRANVSKIAHGVSSLEWGITRTADDNGLTVKRPDIIKGAPDYRRKALAALEEEGKAEAIFDHPFLTLWKNPCPALPGGAARKLAQVYYEIVGEVFFVVDRGPRDAWIKSDFSGRPLPTALWPIPPTWVKRFPTPDQPTFEIRHAGLQLNDIPMSEVLWLKDPDPVNPYGRGVGLFNSLSDELDSDENAARMISYSFYNRNRPDVLVALPNASDQELQAFRADWVANLQGVQNTLKSHFVNVEAKVDQIGYDFREMQVIDLRRHTRDTIRQVPGTPPEMLGIQDQSNRSTIEAAEFIFNKHVIEPRAEVWREFLSSQVLVEYDPRAVLDYVSPVQEDKNFTLQVATGRPEVLRVNEVRKLAGLPALTEEEGGKLFFVNGAFTPTLAQAPAPGGPAPGQPGGPPAGPGTGLSEPGFEGGINVPGAPQMHLSVPGAAGSAESGLPAGMAPGLPPSPPGPPPVPAAPGFEAAPKDPFAKGITKIHHPHVVRSGAKWKVVDSDGHVYGTHDSQAGAEAQVAALYAAKDSEKGARAAGRTFRPSIADADLSPDQAILVAKWAKLNGHDLDLALVAKTAPIPVSDSRPEEWARRALAHLGGFPTKAWDPMFGPWCEEDTEILDSLLIEKEYNEDQPRDSDGRFARSGGVGEAGRGAARAPRHRRVDGDHSNSRPRTQVQADPGLRGIVLGGHPARIEPATGGGVLLAGGPLRLSYEGDEEAMKAVERANDVAVALSIYRGAGRIRYRKYESEDHLRAEAKRQGIEMPEKKKAVRLMRIKGDFEGHPFRGNQWSDGQANAEGKERAAREASDDEIAMAEVGTNVPDSTTSAKAIASEPTTTTEYPFDPDVELDGDKDGVTDAARVGVPAEMVPPPPQVPRLPNLTAQERAVESAFADAFEADPDKLAADFEKMVMADGSPAKFEADAAKNLFDKWKGEGLTPEERAEVRSTLNTALHQTADAIAKRAFLAHLDKLSPEMKAKGLLVTVGGCGAGKGFALKTLAKAGFTEFNASQYGVIWDSAGDQNATENTWLLEEAEKRGIPVTYAYVSSDPEVAWADPQRGVVQRAMDPKDGRMVDAKVFADSYVLGARNHDAFAKAHQGEAKFVFVQNGAKIERLEGVPSSDLARDRRKLHDFAVETVSKLGDKLPPRIKRGALIGQRIWPAGRHERRVRSRKSA